MRYVLVICLSWVLAVVQVHAEQGYTQQDNAEGDEQAQVYGGYSQRDEVQAFARALEHDHHLDYPSLIRAFEDAQFQPSVIRAMEPPSSPNVRSWERYRPRFVNAIRIRRGKAFMQEYSEALQRAEAMSGVPAEIIAAIIGVETIYGSDTGKYRLLDALTTLAFDYPRRAEYFKEELTHYFLFLHEQKLQINDVYGSFAGAVGYPQFMPSNLRTLAMDFDGDGKIDLRNSPVDAIGSVARFLQQHGWQPNAPIATPLKVKKFTPPESMTEELRPSLQWQTLSDWPVQVDAPPEPTQLFAIVPLETPQKKTEYWLGYYNFYVLSRYNRSSFYAMSVYQLAQALRSSSEID